MSTISLRLSESLHAQARLLAEQESIPINQLIATSLAEKMSALLTGEYLEARAMRRSREAFEGVLDKVKDRPPIVCDEPYAWRRREAVGGGCDRDGCEEVRMMADTTASGGGSALWRSAPFSSPRVPPQRDYRDPW